MSDLVGLTDAELAAVRADFDQLLPDLAEHRRKTAGTWASAGPDLPCRLKVGIGIDPGQDRLSEAAAAVDANAVVRLPYDADVRRLDSLTIGGRRGEVRLVIPRPRAHLTVLVNLEGVQ